MTVDPARCPLCGEDNACGIARGTGTCWCFAAKIPEDVLAHVPPDLRNVACVCERCASGLDGMRAIPTWEPLSDEALADQRRTFDRMRGACPLAQSPRGVTLFRHADVVAAATDPATFSSAVSAHRQVPNSLDPPEHIAFRAVVDSFFTPERMRALEPRLRIRARQIVSALPRRTAIEAITELGYPFAVHAQADWLGWQGAEDELLAWMAENHAATRSRDRARAAAVAAAFDEIVAAQVRRRRASGDAAPHDPTTELLHVRVNGERLSDADIVSVLRNWTAGDLGSIAAALGVVIHFLATHPEIQDALRADARDLAPAIDEMLRIDDPFLVNRRVVTAATQVAGFELESGTRIYLNWTSANRDEAVFGDPDVYRPREHAARNLVYGIGPHVCPGRPLATLELVVATATLLELTSSIELATDEVAERETYPVGGWRRLPVRLI
ncbi:MAG TPA: cysteine-rich CWC family protein [Vicinamibacterales bacterium]|jgi:cytochrome P450|nr:cysteine-rich CWC family protein [Vicinamibacterales bacterium]